MSKGYKLKITGTPHSYKKPFFCPHCKRPTGTIDDKWLESLGICSVCVINYVDERKKPTIDLSQYARPGSLFDGMTQQEIDEYFLSGKNK